MERGISVSQIFLVCVEDDTSFAVTLVIALS